RYEYEGVRDNIGELEDGSWKWYGKERREVVLGVGRKRKRDDVGGGGDGGKRWRKWIWGGWD
ncbi:hypothetical protein, partial [Siminovitchia fortis]|uniref:hypothetical protein n=1 Tax=Siminovitchia fortis TaxID=254758 RepID=UPI001C930BB7